MSIKSIKGYCSKCNRVRMHKILKLNKLYIADRNQTTAQVLKEGYVCKEYVEEQFTCETCGNRSKYILKITF